MDIKKIDDGNFDKFIGKKGGRLKALKIGAAWCSPCKMLDKELPEIVLATPKVDWGIADIDESDGIRRRFSIMSVPQILFFKNGEKVGKALVGLYPKEEIVNACRKLA